MTHNYFKIPPKLSIEELKRLAELYKKFKREDESTRYEEEKEGKDYSEL